MPRSRILKPDFWSDSKMVRLSPYGRLFYMGMWNFALCDNGHLPDDPDELKLKILPADPVDPDELIAELVKLDRVRRMVTAEGETFLWAVRLPHHSKVDVRWKTKCPYCALSTPANPCPPEPTETPRHSRESHRGSPTLAETPGHSDVVNDVTPGESQSHQTSPKLADTQRRYGKDGLGKDGLGVDGGAAETVTTPPPLRDLEMPPRNDPPGPAERIITRWIDSLRKPPQRRIVRAIGQHVAEALRDGCDPADVAEALGLWQQRGQLGPGALPGLIHQIANQPTPGTNVVPITARAAPPRPSTTDQRVSDGLALAAHYRAIEAAEASR